MRDNQELWVCYLPPPLPFNKPLEVENAYN